MKIKCPNCEYEWITKTKMFWITCPRCMKKFKLNGQEVELKGGIHK